MGCVCSNKAKSHKMQLLTNIGKTRYKKSPNQGLLSKKYFKITIYLLPQSSRGR